MDKQLVDRLNADAPAWLQAAFFGLFTSLAVALAVLALLSGLLPDSRSNLIPWFALGVGLVFYGGYVVWATPRVRVLRIYGEVLARVLDEPIAAARARVWSWRGPGWRMVGVAVLLPILALTAPASLLLIASMSSITSTALDASGGTGAYSRSPIGWLLVAVSVVLIAAIGWLAYRMARRNETDRLLGQAARDKEQADTLVEQAVELTRGVFPRSTGSWIGGAALYAWVGSYAYGEFVDALHIGRTLEILIWVILSTAVAVVAIRHARLAGAPVAVWTGVVLWVLVGTILGGLVYAGSWDAFGPLLLEGEAGDWLAPREFIRQVGVGLLADVPLILAAWMTAIRTRPALRPPA